MDGYARFFCTTWARGASLAAAACLSAAAFAAQTDISSLPMASTRSAQVKPNIMLLMDVSGSMTWGHMPDEVESLVARGEEGFDTGQLRIGYKSAQCNVLYYNPTQTYVLPKKPDGTSFPVPSFTAAPYAGYAPYYAAPDYQDTSTVDLSSAFRAYDSKTLRHMATPDAEQAAYYYVYAGTDALHYAARPCTDLDTGASQPASTGNGTWTRKIVGANSGPGNSDERLNFAIWYSYYRTRISMMKSAASLAFTPLTSSFRVGFITMYPKDAATDPEINPAKYVAIDDFTGTHRITWFNKLFSQMPGRYDTSPAREGLARVGRHYAGKQDGINAGMTGDPVQYSCQQNFTIMTTDGYWNAQDESPSGGPVQLDGTTLVGQQDAPLTDASGLRPRPIFDGYADGTRIVEDNVNTYSHAACGTFAYLSTAQTLRSTTQTLATTTQATQSTVQHLKSTLQNLKSTLQNLTWTRQTTQSTSQHLQSTTQRLSSTHQNLQNTTQITQSSLQVEQSTRQNLQSTAQRLQSTSQNVATTSQLTQTVTIERQSTTQNLQSTHQNLQSTTQVTKSTQQILQSTAQRLQSTHQNLATTTQRQQRTLQKLQSTVKNLQSTTQNLQSTTQATQTVTQLMRSTLQKTQSTTQRTTTTTQVRRSTRQDEQCGPGEFCRYVPPATCVASGNVSCYINRTGPTLVASCVPSAPTADNFYTEVTCQPTTVGPVGTQSCTDAAASASNNYTATTCQNATSGPTPVESCAAVTANAGNSWTATTCADVTTGPTAVGSCTPVAASSTNNWTATTCSPSSSGPVGVASCTPESPTSGNGWKTITCGSSNTSNVPVATCSASGPTSDNGYMTTTCSSSNTSNVAVASCSASGPTSSNGYVTTTCPPPVTTTDVPVQTCSASSASMGNGWVTTTCRDNYSAWAGVSSCTPVTANSGNNWTTTECQDNNHTNTPVQTCSASGPDAGNGYTTTTCPAPVVTTNVPVDTCNGQTAASGNSWTTITCSDNNTTNVPVASCTVQGKTAANSYTATTCPAPITTGPTGVAACSTDPASTSNNFVATICGHNDHANTPVQTCTASGPASDNGYTTTTCPAPVVTSNVPVQSCTGTTASGSNSWVTTTCSTNNTSNVSVASCTPETASAGNAWTTTTCNTFVESGPTVVSSCTPQLPDAGNGYRRISCGTTDASNPVSACLPSDPDAGNGWTTTTCSVNNTGPTPVASCTPSGPTSGNNWTTTTCSDNNTNDVPVASCTPSTASSGNSWTTTTCPAAVVTGPTPVASCTPAAAGSGNSWTETTCANVTSGPTGVASCTPVTASAGNSWKTITCGNNDHANTPVQTCTVSGPTALNSYTTTTCPAPVVTSNVPVQTCTDAAASSGNNWTATTCSNHDTTDVPVASCSADVASSGNNWTTTTCTTASTGPAGVASCSPVPASSGNNWTETTCGSNDHLNVASASCTPEAASTANGWTERTCPAPLRTGPTPVESCDAATASAGNDWIETTCPPPVVTTQVPVSACTPEAASDSNGWTATTCEVNETGPVGVTSCTPVAASVSNNWTETTCGSGDSVNTPVASCTPESPSTANGWLTRTCAPNVTTDVPAASCSAAEPSADNGWMRTTCNVRTTPRTLVDRCQAETASSTNNWTATLCETVQGKELVYTTKRTVTTTQVSGGLPVGAPSIVETTNPLVVVNGYCAPPGEEDPLPTPNPQPSGSGRGPSPIAGCAAWPCTITNDNPGRGSENSLADVAQYYYATPLRAGTAWPATGPGSVPGVGDGPEDDRATWQHMTTFAIGLGVSGTLKYRPDYRTAAAGDFADIRNGAKSWPLWPDPDNYRNSDSWNNARSIDDFWHAAVNGRGQYFSADRPTSVVAGLGGALAAINDRLSAGAAPGSSTMQPTVGNNMAFVSSYRTNAWTGEVQAYLVDLSTGMTASSPVWSAQSQLDTKTGDACDNRRIYLMRPGSTASLVNFTWDSQACDSNFLPTGTADTGLNAAEKAHFSAANVQLLSQYPGMTDGSAGSPNQRSAAQGANLVNFLRGQRGAENFEAGAAGKLYRKRDHVLGDIIGGQPVHVKGPVFTYQDPGYDAFKASHATRTPMLYVPANDGMLHAFYAGVQPPRDTDLPDPNGGKEAWAIIPSAVLPKLYLLADTDYRNLHQFYVDGTPVVGDIADAGSNWKTVLVGGLNAGGKGYYALDVTDPANPRALWEFNFSSTCYDGTSATAGADCNLGLSFGKPIITKVLDASYPQGRWVVLLTSGYNNVNGTAGDGQGYLYVLDANTGRILYKIATGAGDAATPSGLAQINTYVDDGAINNTALRVYGGDLLGNVWRFDVNDTHSPSGREATLLGQAKDRSETPQPITTRLELAEVKGKPMVFAATGRLLGASDLADTQVQSIYGIVDPLNGSPVYSDLRAALRPLAMAPAGNSDPARRSISCDGSTSECAATSGWVVDLPDAGERVNVDMQMVLGTLVIGSNVPQSSACSTGGYSWFNYLDFATGTAVTAEPADGVYVSEYLADSLIVGFNSMRLPSGEFRALLRTSSPSSLSRKIPATTPPPIGKRISWREIAQ